jgi:hypothetical protein
VPCEPEVRVGSDVRYPKQEKHCEIEALFTPFRLEPSAVSNAIRTVRVVFVLEQEKTVYLGRDCVCVAIDIRF